jgi:hypothetical protein
MYTTLHHVQRVSARSSTHSSAHSSISDSSPACPHAARVIETNTLEDFVMSNDTDGIVFLSLQAPVSVGCNSGAFVNKAPFSGYWRFGGTQYNIAFTGDILVTGLIPGQVFLVKAYCVPDFYATILSAPAITINRPEVNFVLETVSPSHSTMAMPTFWTQQQTPTPTSTPTQSGTWTPKAAVSW